MFYKINFIRAMCRICKQNHEKNVLLLLVFIGIKTLKITLMYFKANVDFVLHVNITLWFQYSNFFIILKLYFWKCWLFFENDNLFQENDCMITNSYLLLSVCTLSCMLLIISFVYFEENLIFRNFFIQFFKMQIRFLI